MTIAVTDGFKKDFRRLPEQIQVTAIKAIGLLTKDLYHPSLHVKKVKGEILKGYSNIFECRININYRILFLIEPDSYVLLRCGKHDDFF